MTSPVGAIPDSIEKQTIVARLHQSGYPYLADIARELLDVTSSKAECIDFVDQLSYFIGDHTPNLFPTPTPSRIIDVSVGPDGSAYITLPDELIAHLGCDESDQIIWIDNKDGSFSIKKRTDYDISLLTADTHPC